MHELPIFECKHVLNDCMDEYEYIVVVNIHLAYNLSSFFLLNIYNVYIVNTRSFVLKIKHTSSKLWHVLLLGKLVGTIRKFFTVFCFGVDYDMIDIILSYYKRFENLSYMIIAHGINEVKNEMYIFSKPCRACNLCRGKG